MEIESAKNPLEECFSRTRADDRELAELARRQHGVMARRQLTRRGFSTTAIDKRIRAGRLHRIHAGVYSLAPRQLLTRQGRWMAAVLASEPEALLSHGTAAALWGIRGYSGGAVHVTIPRKSASTREIRRHFSVVPADEREVEEGIPATSVHRTILDLAARVSLDDVVAMMKEAEYRHRYDRLSLPDLLERHPGRRGFQKVQFALKRIAAEPSGPKRSKLEQRFAPFLRQHSLPLPRFNDPIALGSRLYVADCHWPACRLIVELDGWQGHSSRSAFQDDRLRDRRLHVAGYSVIHLTWNQLEVEPEDVVSDLRSALLYERP